MTDRTERSIMWLFFWLAILTLGDPDLLDMIIELVRVLTLSIGE